MTRRTCRTAISSMECQWNAGGGSVGIPVGSRPDDCCAKLALLVPETKPAAPSSVAAGVAVGQRQIHCATGRRSWATANCHQFRSAWISRGWRQCTLKTNHPDQLLNAGRSPWSRRVGDRRQVHPLAIPVADHERKRFASSNQLNGVDLEG